MRFKVWLEVNAQANTQTEPFTTNDSDRMRQIQQQMLDNAVRRGDKEWEREIGTRIRNRTPSIGSFSDSDLLDIDFDDKGNIIKPKPKSVTPEEWAERKRTMYRGNMKAGDLAMAQSNLDDLEAGYRARADVEDDEESHVLHGLPPGSKVGIVVKKPQGSTHDTMHHSRIS